MKILKRDNKGGKLKLLLETQDDLWHISKLLNPGDIAYAVTYRREEVSSDKIRSERGEKKRVFLGLEVESTEFQEFTDRLRVHGIISDAQKDVGSYHTFILEPGDDITVQKELWRPEEQLRVKEAVDGSNQPVITFVSIDHSDAVIAILRHYGLQTLAHIHSTRSGKRYQTTDKETDFYADVMEHFVHAYTGGPLVVCGPGYAKESFVKYGREKNAKLFSEADIIATGQDGLTGINELLKKGSTVKLLEKSRVAFETQIVEQLFGEISKNGLFTYGKKEVSEALSKGAVETLLVDDTMLRDKETHDVLDKLDEAGAKLVVVSSNHEAGKRLLSLGGLGAILRYKI